jgi:hypothetical protein
MWFPGRFLASIQLSAIAEHPDILYVLLAWAYIDSFTMAITNVGKLATARTAIMISTDVDELTMFTKSVINNAFNCVKVPFPQVAVFSNNCASRVSGVGK